MSKPPAARPGDSVKIRKRDVPFSYWPVHKTARFCQVKPLLFSTSPWVLIQHSIKKTCTASNTKTALAFCQQAEAYYVGATVAGALAAKPVLLYYCYLNLAKALMLSKRLKPNCPQAMHGIKDRRSPSTSTSIDTAYLECDKADNNGYIQVFSELLKCFDTVGLAAQRRIDLKYLMPQAVAGHRLWASATKGQERFLSIDSIEFNHNSTSKQVWMNLNIQESDVNRMGISHKKLLSDSRLGSSWKEVLGHPDMVTLEQASPLNYVDQPTERIEELVKQLRPYIWSTVSSQTPYRRYYLSITPIAERAHLLPEAVAIYSLAFYFGSITRYRPQQFHSLADGPYGRFIQACLGEHPTQFIYLMASEFAKQEVTKPAIV